MLAKLKYKNLKPLNILTLIEWINIMLSSQQLQNTQGFVRLKSFVNNQSNNTELVDQTNTLLIAITLKNQTLGLQPDDLTNIANLVETLQSRIEILKINNIQLNEDLMYAHYKNIFIKKITTINHQLNKNPTVRPPDLDSIVKLTSTLRNAISPDNIFYKVIMTLMSETKVAISTQTTTMEVNDLSINYESLTALRKTLLTFFNGGSARPFYSLLPNNIKEISTIINSFVYLINMSVTLVQHEFPDTIETQNIFTQLNQLMPQFNDTLSTIINQMDQDDDSQQTTNSLQPIQTQTDMLCKKMQQLIITVKNQLPGEQQQAISSITERAIQTATTIQNITTDQKPPSVPPLNLTALPQHQTPTIDSPSKPIDTDRRSSTDTARTDSTMNASSNSSRMTSEEKLNREFIIKLIWDNFKNETERKVDRTVIEHAQTVAKQIATNILRKIPEFEKQKNSFKFQKASYSQTKEQKTQEQKRQQAAHETQLGKDIFNFITNQMTDIFPKYDSHKRSNLTWLTTDQCLGQKKPTARLLENVLRKKFGLEEKTIPAETPRSYRSIDSTPRNNPKDEPKATEEPLYVFPQELESAIIEFLQLIPISPENKQLLLDQTKRDLSSQQDSDQWLHFFKQKTLEIQRNIAEPLTKISSNEQIANQIQSTNQNQLASIDSPELRAKQEAINKLISEYLSLQISLPQSIENLDMAFYDYIQKKQALLTQLISNIESLSKDISQTTTAASPPTTIEVLTPRTEALATPRAKTLSSAMQAYYFALIGLLKIIYPTTTEQFITFGKQIKEELLIWNLKPNEAIDLCKQCIAIKTNLELQQGLQQNIDAKKSILEEESNLINDALEDIINDITIEERIETLQTEIKKLQASKKFTQTSDININDTEPFIKTWQKTIQDKLSAINKTSSTRKISALSEITQELTKAINDLQKFIYIPPTDNNTYILKGQETLIAQEQQLNQQRTQTLKLSPLQLPSTEALLTEVDSIQIQQTNTSLPDICSQVISAANQLILKNRQSQQQELTNLNQLEDYIKTNTEKISLEKSLLSTKADILTAIKIIEITEQAKLTIERLEKITQANQLASQFIELYNAIEQPLESSTIQTLKEKIQNLSNDIPHSIIQLLLKI